MKTWQKLKKNSTLWSRYFIREKVIAAMREFFVAQKFHEVEVPLMAPALPAESYYEVFETWLLNRLRQPKRAFLTTSPEMFLKKLLVSGIGNCFSLTKAFRNTEDMSTLHNPEFTILEWYRVDADYKDVMRDTEELFCFIYQRLYSSSDPSADGESRSNVIPAKLGIHSYRSRVKPGMTQSVSSRLRSDNNKYILSYQNKTIDITPPWERITMVEAFAKYAHINLLHVLTLPALAKMVQVKGYTVTEGNTWEELFHQIYLNEVEPHLGQGRPTIIYDFPLQLAALAKRRYDDPRFAERFEVYIAGLELGDCYSELTDWREQDERFKKEIGERRRLGKIDHPYDQDFIEALKAGLPKCAGLALGVDRVVMLFADRPRIQDTLFFPAEEMWEE